jgi:hypothetical protein
MGSFLAKRPARRRFHRVPLALAAAGQFDETGRIA